MAVPKKKVSKSRRNMRRAHHALTPTRSHECGNCGEPRLAHQICNACGHYDGRQVISQLIEDDSE